MCALALAACGTSPSLGADAGEPDAAPRGQGSAPRGALVINEVSPRPSAGADWIEIYNRSDAAVDLCEFFVTDSLDRLDHYLHLGGSAPPADCAPQMLGPSEYLVIYADDKAELGGEHAPFKLGASDEAHIVSVFGEAIDSLVYLHRDGDRGLSLARVPNGEGLFFASEESLGAENE